jgi:pyridoxamine 5'-phosphate oxidase-like protein
MARWSDVEQAAPELAAHARAMLDAHVHKTIATLRRDGSPRISGTEVIFADGELWFGSMWQSLKAQDIQRDPRFALHSGSDDPPGWEGDAKLAGRAVEVTDEALKAAIIGGNAPPGPNHLFRADIAELSVVRLGEPRDHLVIEAWNADRGLTRRTRR